MTCPGFGHSGTCPTPASSPAGAWLSHNLRLCFIFELPQQPSQPVSRTAPPSPAQRLSGGFAQLKAALRQQRERELQRQRSAAALASAARAAQRQHESDAAAFARAMQGVRPMPQSNTHALVRPRIAAPVPSATQAALDERRVLHDALSDEFDISTLLDVDDQMSFRRPGIGPDVTRRLRSGSWSIQRQLDLHGLRSDEARAALGAFIRAAHRTGLRCVRIIHGKGLGSAGGLPVLKPRVQRWLVQKNEVLAFVQARAQDGGAGALIVLLAPSAHRHH